MSEQLTAEMVEKMEAGPAMDELIGREVFKFWPEPDAGRPGAFVWWGKHPSMGAPHKAYASCCMASRLWGPSVSWNSLPKFSTDDSAAVAVLNHESPCGWFQSYCLFRYGSGYAIAKQFSRPVFSEAGTFALCVCRAVLKHALAQQDAGSSGTGE